MVECATPEDMVFRELVHQATLSDHVELRRALQGLRGEQQLRCVVSAVLGIVEANAHRDASDEEIAELESGWNAHAPDRPGSVVICLHGQCPHLAACLGAGDCTERAMMLPAAGLSATFVGPAVASGTNRNDLPGYLPLRKIVGEGGDA